MNSGIYSITHQPSRKRYVVTETTTDITARQRDGEAR